MQMVWTAPLNAFTSIADGTALNTSTTLTDIAPAASVPTIPAKFFQAGGGKLLVKAYGVFGTNTTGTNNLTLGVYWGGVGGTALITTGAVTMTNSLTNAPWELECLLTFRTIGSAAAVKAKGWWHFGTSVSAITTAPMPNTANTGTASVDTTAQAALTIGGTWSVSNASNTITCQDYTVLSVQ